MEVTDVERAMKTRSIISASNAGKTEDMGQNDAQMLVEGDRIQLADTGEIRYVLDTQSDGNGNIDMKVDQKDKINDEYILNNKEEDKGSAIEIEKNQHRKFKRDNSHKIEENNGEQKISKLTCNLCTYITTKKNLLLRHMKTHSEERPHKCSICERCFKTLCSLQKHLNIHNDVKPKLCKNCHSTFTTYSELMKHIRSNHNYEKPHKCEECDYASMYLSKLQRHVRCHTGERLYQCPQCTYASVDMFKLKRHLRTHTGEKPYKCDDCNMCFAQSNDLKSHKFVHNRSEKKVFPCELCPATCGRKIDLRKHIKNLHTFQKPLKCTRCGTIFRDRYSWKIHIKTHENEKCFKCNMCPYASTTSSKLKLHMKKHIGGKQFFCDECDRSFWHKQSLRQHQNLIHDPDYGPKLSKEKIHTCHQCNRNYARIGNLRKHLAVHDQEFSQHERPQNFTLGGNKLIEPDKTEDTANKTFDSNKKDSEDQKAELKPDKETSKLKREMVVAEDETDEQLQYVVLVVDDLQLMDEKEHQNAPEYDKKEEQDILATTTSTEQDKPANVGI